MLAELIFIRVRQENRSLKFIVKWNFQPLVGAIVRKEIVKKLLDYKSPISDCGHSFTQKRSFYVG